MARWSPLYDNDDRPRPATAAGEGSTVLEGAAATPLLRKPHIALLPPLGLLLSSTLAPSPSVRQCKAMQTKMSKAEGKRA
jgi:hypothetical protein